MADQPGVVGAPWRPRRSSSGEGQTTATRHAPTRLTSVTRPLATRATETQRALSATAVSGPATSSNTAAGRRSQGEKPAAAAPGLHARAMSAALGAALTGWLAAHALAPSPLAPAAAALAAAGLLVALPRVGYAILALGLTLIAVAQGHSGEALMLALAALVPIAVAPRGEPLWSLAGGAPLLGIVGLGGVWPALAARATSIRARATLGLAGWLWLAIGSPLSGTNLYIAPPPGGPPISLWGTSAYDATHHVLGSLLSSGALAAAPVWAVAAALLPMLISGRSLLLDAARVGVWAVGLLVGTELAIGVTHFGVGSASLHGGVVGAAVGGLIALVPTALATWRRTHSGYLQAGVP
jgi:hypothetical protein